QVPPIEPTSRQAPVELSFAQQRLWFLAQFESLSRAYHIPIRLRLAGPLDRTALRRALDRIVARHEALRTPFGEGEGPLVQKLAPETCGLALSEHDLFCEVEPAEQLESLARQETAAQFDLEHGPLIRGRLVRLQEQEHVLLLTIHHIVFDGWSIGVF